MTRIARIGRRSLGCDCPICLSDGRFLTVLGWWVLGIVVVAVGTWTGLRRIRRAPVPDDADS